MKNGKLESQSSQHEKKHHFKKIQLLILSLLVVTTVTVGGTVAYLTTNTAPVVNTFEPSHVTCKVTESFDGKTKSNVNVKNTSDIDAYIRVKLVTYRVNDAGQHIGGVAEIPNFTPGDGWVKYGEYYYYTSPVAKDAQPATNLIGSINLTDKYADADGGKQVIEVMAEAIQSEPAAAVGEAWGVTISAGSVTAYSNN